MSQGLSLEKLPEFAYSSFRYFEKHERHLTRTYNWDVLVMVFEGVLRFHEDGELVEVKAGEYYIQRHGLLQEGIPDCDAPKYFFIQWTGGEYVDDTSALPLKGKASFAELFPLFKELETLRVTNAPLVEKSMVFYKILSKLRHGGKNSSNDVVTKVISYATSDIRKPFSLDEAALRCGYSKNHIITIFKKETGKTPYTYILDMKIEMAKQLLLNSESSLSSISIECGFGNYINFYRSFVNTVGLSPAEWRKKHAE